MRSTTAPAVAPEVTGAGDEIMGNDVGCGEEEGGYARAVCFFARIMEGQAAQAVDGQSVAGTDIEAPRLLGDGCLWPEIRSSSSGPLL